MFSRLSTQLRSYLATATGPRSAGDHGPPDNRSAGPVGRHPIVIALSESSGNGEPWRRAVFGHFGDLPDYVLAQVASYVTVDEVGPWSRVCRQAFAVLRPEQLWHQLPEAVSSVVSLPMLLGAVRDIEQWSVPRAGHWLATLAGRLPWLENGSVREGFALVLDAARRLPPAGQGAVLEALAATRASWAGPDAPCRIGLPLEQRLHQAACMVAQGGSARTFCVVVSHCSYDLAQSLSPAQWDATIRGLPAPCRAQALVAVQARLDRIWHAATDEKAWTDRLALAAELPPQDRDLGLIALAVPNAHLRETEAQRRFEAMLPLAPSLPPLQRAGLYAALACLAMASPQRHVRAAWSGLMDAVAALGPTGAAQVCPYLYGALACMPQTDLDACAQALRRYLFSAAPDMHGVAADITRAPHSGGRWQLALAVRDTRYWITLPQELGGTVVRFLRAEHAIVPAAPVAPARTARMPTALHARALASRAARLQNLPTEPGFSLDREDIHWNALLEGVKALPEDMQRAPLAELGGAVARSVALYTARLAMISFGLPVHGPDPVSEAWHKLAIAAQRLPMAHQIELATQFAPQIRSQGAWKWAFDVACVAPVPRKAALLLGLLHGSERWGHSVHSNMWAHVFEQARSLPRLPRIRILLALQDAFPPQSVPGWDRATARQQLREALVASQTGP